VTEGGVQKEVQIMNLLFDNVARIALLEGAVAGGLVLVISSIAHYVFDAPALPYVYGFAVGIALVVLGIRYFVRTHDGSHHGA
jgi:hypothetical protein